MEFGPIERKFEWFYDIDVDHFADNFEIVRAMA